MDEKPLQLLGESHERISAKPLHLDPDTQLPKPGYCEKVDSEYVRCETASIFMFTEPLEDDTMYLRFPNVPKAIMRK